MDNQKRQYSIIVVTYNNADGLKRTLKSIRQLDYAQKEVVVIDGDSNDTSLDVIAEHQDVSLPLCRNATTASITP